VKVLSRVASPAGFALVLLLFFVLPFLSVSCDVPGYGEAGANYSGSHLVSGTDPEVPAELRDLGDDPGSPTALSDPPDPGVQVLAILLALLAAAGVLTVLVPRYKARLLSGSALAAGTLVLTVVTMVVARSNLESELLDWARTTGAAENPEGLEGLESGVGEVVHTEVGFWLMVVLLTLIAAVTAILGLFGDRLRAAAAERASDDGGGGLSGLSFGTSDHDDRSQGSSGR
jgi:hypothetical protein